MNEDKINILIVDDEEQFLNSIKNTPGSKRFQRYCGRPR